MNYEKDEICEDENIKNILPSMNLSLPSQEEANIKDVSTLVSDEALLEMMTKIAKHTEEDRTEIDDYLVKFADMVFNGGDATSSTKEAVVNLIKIKSDLSDKNIKLLDIATRIKMKEKDTFPRYLANSVSQKNTININSGKRALLETINKIKNDEK